jgi:hypothetical protein
VRAVEPRLRRALVLALVLYVAGALGVEMVESQVATRPGGDVSLAYHLLVVVEEGLELTATALVLVALVRHLALVAPRWQLSFGDDLVAVGPERRAGDGIERDDGRGERSTVQGSASGGAGR